MKSMHNQSNISKGDNAKCKKGRVVILVHATLCRPVLRFYQVPSKYSEGYSKKSGHEIYFKQRELAQKVRKPEMSFLYLTCRLFLCYISTKYHKNIPKGIRLTEWTRNQCIITVKYNNLAQSKKAEL